MAMFSSQMSSTPFSVRDILNLEHNHEDMVSLDMSLPTSSCMMFKPEPFVDAVNGAALFAPGDEQDAKVDRGTSLDFSPAFYGKSFLEMDLAKDVKSDMLDAKEKKGENSIISNPRLNLLWIEYEENLSELFKLFKKKHSLLKRTL